VLNKLVITFFNLLPYNYSNDYVVLETASSANCICSYLSLCLTK
jgi:hypothetical protein